MMRRVLDFTQKTEGRQIRERPRMFFIFTFSKLRILTQSS